MSYPQNPTLETVQEVQALRQELAETHKKLREYADTVISLHGELRSLRDSICKSCKQKFILPNLASSQAKPAANSPSFVNRISHSQSPAKPTNSRFAWRRLLKARASDDFPGPSGPSTSTIQKSTITLMSQPFPSTLPISSPPTHSPSPPPVLTAVHENVHNPLTIASSNRAIAQKRTGQPQWYPKRDAGGGLGVKFERAFTHKDPVRSIRFSADGKYLAAALGDGIEKTNWTIAIYDVETGTKICALEEYEYYPQERPGILCVCFSPCGRYLVVGDSEGSVTVWNISKKGIRNIFRGHRMPVESVVFSPNGRLVASASWDDTVRISSMRNGSAKVFSDNAQTFWSVRFSPNGQYVAAGNDDRILRMWDVRTGRLVKRWSGYENVWSLAFTPNGRLLSGSANGFVSCWDVGSIGIVHDGEPEVTPMIKYKRHIGGVRSIAISPNAQWIASGSENKTAFIWDADSAVRQCTLIGHEDIVSSVDFSPAGGYLALGSHDGHVTLWRYTRI